MKASRALAAILDAQPANTRALPREQVDALWVSMVLVDGTCVGVSRYGDQVWRLGVSTHNASRSRFRIDFELVPPSFRAVAKAVLYRYLMRGLPGGKRPGAKAVKSMFSSLLPFLRYLDTRGVKRLSDVDELACLQYVDFARSQSKQTGSDDAKPLASATLTKRFMAVESLVGLSQYTDDELRVQPWEGANATQLAGDVGPTGGKTPLIPDDAFVGLFRAAHADLLRGASILKLRDELDSVEVALRGRSESRIREVKTQRLAQGGWEHGLRAFNEALLDIRTACYVIVGSLTGCRMQELASIERGSLHATEDDDGSVYWWMKGVSTKTDAGETEWMVPPAAVDALRLMEWWARPLQDLIVRELAERRAVDPLDPNIAEAAQHVDALFLGAPAHDPSLVRIIGTTTWNNNLNRYARKHNIAWDFASHQFRRKFANYAARSRFGDLRYLKEHFKHWAMDMTLSYALNEAQEMALFMEIEEELDDVKRGVVRDWLDPSEPLAGGYGTNLVAWRGGEGIAIFKDRRTMVAAIADSTAIRSNLHGWCTADDDLCVGNSMEPTRCSGCDSGVIGRVHGHIYQAMYDDLKQTLTCDDIGPGGIARINRDLVRCRQTLAQLGYDPEAPNA